MQPISSKQAEYIREATHRWNVKTGATRSGKTYLDMLYVIPSRIRERAGEPGLVVLLGNTRSTLQRNVLDPMAEIYGAERVGRIRADSTAMIFGERCYCLGADNKKHVDRLRGSSIKYAYGDEVTTWNKEVFEMLKSRLDKPGACFDGTCNPESPRHWFREFLGSDVDLYSQAYTIDDNPYLPADFVEQLKREYAGTIYYDRYILGLWVAAEGVIYRPFADNPERYLIDEFDLAADPIRYATIGVDFGGGTSAHAFSCMGFTRDGSIVVLDEYREQEALTPEKLAADFVDFVRRCAQRWRLTDAWCDSAEQTLINGLRVAAAKARLPINIGNARKKPINDRIRAVCLLMGMDRFKVIRTCRHTIDALQTALWDSKHVTEDVRLDDGTTNIDSLDAMEYAIEREITALIER